MDMEYKSSDFFHNKKGSPPPPLLPPRAKRQAPKYIDVYNQQDRIPSTTQRLQVFEKNEGAILFLYIVENIWFLK
jgi:hypothetical protein